MNTTDMQRVWALAQSGRVPFDDAVMAVGAARIWADHPDLVDDLIKDVDLPGHAYVLRMAGVDVPWET